MKTAPRGNASIDRVYVHTNEGPENDRSAWGLKVYLDGVDAGYHVNTDNHSLVRCAADDLIVEGCGGDNTHSLSICIIGYADQTLAQWRDAYSLAAIENAAQQVALWCKTYNIPVERIRPGAPPTDRGIGGHVDNQHPRSGGHTDPGVNFPWQAFLDRVRALIAPIDWKAIIALTQWQARVSANPLRYTQRHADVVTLKALLTQRGYSVEPGPIYGDKVRKAVYDFKRREHLKSTDGRVFGADAAHAILS